MRMWLVNPRMLCTKHLSGEHVETHMFFGTLNKGIGVRGYIDKNLFEPEVLFERHEELKKELDYRRELKGKKKEAHKSEMNAQETKALVVKLPKNIREYKIDKQAALDELCYRCPECRARAEQLLSKGIKLINY